MPPENAGYFHAAYIAAAVVYLVYGWSVVRRMRALRAKADAARGADPR